MSPLRALIPLLVLGPLSSGALAQRVDGKYRPLPTLGFEFRPLADFRDVPVSDSLAKDGLVAQLEAKRPAQVKLVGGGRSEHAPSLKILRLAGVGEPAELVELHFEVPSPELEAEISDVGSPKTVAGRRTQLLGTQRVEGGQLETLFDAYAYETDAGRLVFLWAYPAETKLRRKWSAAVLKSMRSLRPSKGGAAGTEPVDPAASYDALLEHHRADVARTPGWELLEAPSKQYLVKTNSKQKGNIKKVIARLEASRALYERDFPSTRPITAVSVVRLCATREEFNLYGQTGGSVAGYFNPKSGELVLFLGEGTPTKALAVMAHEAFHQYCHHLLGRAQAHRWFDEGHGDYYGAFQLKGKKLVPKRDMKEGLARIPEMREMLRDGKVRPLAEHVRYGNAAWEAQGPTDISCYAQSFALVTFLRDGTAGEVKRKYWKPEYAEILPNYTKALREGYAAIFEEIRGLARKVLDEQLAKDPAERDAALVAEAEDRIAHPWNYDDVARPEIWNAATAASWGKIDEEEFEERWLAWAEKEL